MLLVFGVTAMLSARHKSLTTDEPTHYSFGARMVTHQKQTRVTLSSMAISQLNTLPNFFLRKDRSMVPSTPEAVLCARLPTILAAILLGGLVFAFSARIYDRRAGLLSLAVFCFSPTVLAHSRWVTNDILSTLFIVATLFTFLLYLERNRIGWLLVSAAACGMAQVSKFTALLLFFVLPSIYLIMRKDRLVALFRRWRRQAAEPASEAASTEAETPVPAAGDAPAASAEEPPSVTRIWANRLGRPFMFLTVLLMVVNAAYYFQGTFMQFRQHRFQSAFFKKTTRMLGPLPVLLPSPYIEALDITFHINAKNSGRGNIYMLGKTSRKGFASYFLVALLYKVPLPFWVLFIAAFASLFRRPRLLREEMVILLPAAFFFVYFLFFCSAQIGVRYLMPFLVLCHLFVGRVIFGFAGIEARAPKRAAFGAAGLLLCWMAASSYSYYPHFLSYFNELVSDRKMSYKILSDSNLDWGQNRYYLERYLAKHSLDRSNVDPFPRTGVVIVSANRLTGVSSPVEYRWLRKLRPSSHVAYSYLVYRITPSMLASALRSPWSGSMRPVTLPRNLATGLYREVYANTHLEGEPCSQGTAWPYAPNRVCGRADHFSIRLTGYLRIPKPDDYLFRLTSDDGSRLYLDGKRIIDMWFDQDSASDWALVRLEAGYYPIRIEFYERTGAARLSIRLSSFGTRKPIHRHIFWHLRR